MDNRSPRVETSCSAQDKPWLSHYDKRGAQQASITRLFRSFTSSKRGRGNTPISACTIFKGAVITYKEMDRLTDQVAAAVGGSGREKGRPGRDIHAQHPPVCDGLLTASSRPGAWWWRSIPPIHPAEILTPLNDAGIEVIFAMSRFLQDDQGRTAEYQALRTVIVTNIKEALPPLMRVLFTDC